MRIVIVGGAGFIGKSVTRALLRAGHEVVVLDTASRLASAKQSLDGAESIEFDFTDKSEVLPPLTGTDGLIHLGCTTNPARSMAKIAWDAETNIAPSLRLFDAAASSGVPRVVFASSGGTVYGAPQRLPVLETDPTKPLSAYGVSKLAIENYLALYPLKGISLRVSNPYGMEQLAGATVGVIARYVSAVSRGQPIEIWGDGSVVRDYIAIEDVAEAFRLAIETGDLPGEPYNVGTGQSASISDIVSMVFAVADREVPILHLPSRTYDVPAIVLDSSLFERRAGWAPRTELIDGIAALWAHRGLLDSAEKR